MKPRILHVLTSPRAEGTPRLVLDWLKNPGMEQGLVLLNPNPPDLLDEFKLLGDNLFIFSTGGKGPMKFIRILDAIKKTRKQFKPDLLIAWPQSLAGAIIWGKGINKIQSIIHIGCYPRYNSLFQIAYNYFVYIPIILRKGNFICASDFLYNRLLELPGIPKSKVHRVYNAVKIPRFISGLDREDTPKRKGAVMVSNLETFKNQSFLLDVWAKLKERGYEYTLTLVGGGSQRSFLENKVKTLGLENWVQFTGPINQVPEVLAKNKLFLFPTDFSEGFGTVLVEALASGCWILANDTPACKEVLENGKWGELIPHLDLEKYEEAIISYMEKVDWPYSVQDLRTYLQGFAIETMVKKYLRLGLGPFETDYQEDHPMLNTQALPL
jgi:glycosyltransferase involved in cell wall biosynthesis